MKAISAHYQQHGSDLLREMLIIRTCCSQNTTQTLQLCLAGLFGRIILRGHTLHDVIQAAMGWENFRLHRFGWTMRMGGSFISDSYWESYADEEGRTYPLGSTPIGGHGTILGILYANGIHLIWGTRHDLLSSTDSVVRVDNRQKSALTIGLYAGNYCALRRLSKPQNGLVLGASSSSHKRRTTNLQKGAAGGHASVRRDSSSAKSANA